MRRDVFIETHNVGALRRAMSVLTDTERGQPGIGVVQGEAGRGKTMAATEWHAVNGGVFLRAMEGWTQHAFMQSLTWELTGDRPTGVERCRQRLMRQLGDTPQVIIVDEADRLQIGRIEDLRDIHDMTGCPVLLIGEEGLYPRLHARRRIYSRVTQVVDFQPVSAEDCLLFAHQAAALHLTPEAAHRLAQIAGGSFRMVFGFLLRLEDYAKAQQCDDVDVKTLETAGIRGRA
jgi:hypothetical protein